MKWISSLLTIFALSLGSTAAMAQSAPAPTAPAIDQANVLHLELSTGGTVDILLRPDKAPAHVDRIRILANRGFYNGQIFHRVIEGFMAQTGDGQRFNGTGGSKYPNLPAEFSSVPFKRGIVGMARSSEPNSANSQFFIMFADGSFLNNKYTVVGEVVSGMDVVDKIKRGEPVQDPDKMVKVQVASDIK